MTARQIWEGMLTELNKVNAPSLMLTDFNYFFNKAINQYINKRYNIYDVNQQTTDDLRVLKASAALTTKKVNYSQGFNSDGDTVNLSTLKTGDAKLFGSTYEVDLPKDYLHMLNCICVFKLKQNYKCYDKDNVVYFAAKRLTADAWSVVINDYFNRPTPQRPYYYIHNINISTDLPTNPTTQNWDHGTDPSKQYSVHKSTGTSGGGEGDSNLPRTVEINWNGSPKDISTVEKSAGARYGNASTVRMEIRYGKDDSVFELQGVMVDYIKTPQFIRLTQEQVDLTEDTSQIMEFPDYVCQEIINELTSLVMANIADPRLQTHIPITQSIANPQQAAAPQPAARQAPDSN